VQAAAAATSAVYVQAAAAGAGGIEVCYGFHVSHIVFMWCFGFW